MQIHLGINSLLTKYKKKIFFFQCPRSINVESTYLVNIDPQRNKRIFLEELKKAYTIDVQDHTVYKNKIFILMTAVSNNV